jgi:hypothetical protein
VQISEGVGPGARGIDISAELTTPVRRSAGALESA